MNKNKAIKWCKKTLNVWPRTTKFKAPDGWKWYVSNTPYQLPTYFLGNQDGEYIHSEDFLSE